MIKSCIQKLFLGENLSFDLASGAMEDIMTGDATAAQFGAFVTALSFKGETPEEIAGMAEVMRTKSLRVEPDYPVIDTCGTGGDGSNSFNISTTSFCCSVNLLTSICKYDQGGTPVHFIILLEYCASP